MSSGLAGSVQSDIVEQWEKGKEDELNFWNALLPKDGVYKNENLKRVSTNYVKRLDTSNKVDIPELSPLLAKINKDTVQTLEVGPGPIPRLGIIKTDKTVVVNTLDPLMGKYIDLMKNNGIEIQSVFPNGKFVTGIAEEASKHFGTNSQDLIYCSNALDHCADPVRAIKTLYAVLAEGGQMYLSGIANEADHQKFSGFHQWNIMSDGTDLLISRPGHDEKISEHMPDVAFKTYAKQVNDRQSWHIEISK